MKICTSIEQSKKLIELGIDINTADMYWWNNIEEKRYEISLIDYEFINVIDTPAWSLSALLDIIPNWTMYKTDKINLTCNPYDHCESCYEDPVDAAFEMICWLKEQERWL